VRKKETGRAVNGSSWNRGVYCKEGSGLGQLLTNTYGDSNKEDVLVLLWPDERSGKSPKREIYTPAVTCEGKRESDSEKTAGPQGAPRRQDLFRL